MNKKILIGFVLFLFISSSFFIVVSNNYNSLHNNINIKNNNIKIEQPSLTFNNPNKVIDLSSGTILAFNQSIICDSNGLVNIYNLTTGILTKTFVKWTNPDFLTLFCQGKFKYLVYFNPINFYLQACSLYNDTIINIFEIPSDLDPGSNGLKLNAINNVLIYNCIADYSPPSYEHQYIINPYSQKIIKSYSFSYAPNTLSYRNYFGSVVEDNSVSSGYIYYYNNSLYQNLHFTGTLLSNPFITGNDISTTTNYISHISNNCYANFSLSQDTCSKFVSTNPVNNTKYNTVQNLTLDTYYSNNFYLNGTHSDIFDGNIYKTYGSIGYANSHNLYIVDSSTGGNAIIYIYTLTLSYLHINAINHNSQSIDAYFYFNNFYYGLNFTFKIQSFPINFKVLNYSIYSTNNTNILIQKSHYTYHNNLTYYYNYTIIYNSVKPTNANPLNINEYLQPLTYILLILSMAGITIFVIKNNKRMRSVI
jgi:hypothetical protein